MSATYQPLHPNHRRQPLRRESSPPEPRTPPQTSDYTTSSQSLYNNNITERIDPSSTFPSNLFPTDIDLSAPTSFSPSKARARARQTARLAVLKAWLTSLVPRADQGTISIEDPRPTLIDGHQHSYDGGVDRTQHQHVNQQEATAKYQKLTSLIQAWEVEYLSLQQDGPSISSPSFHTTTDVIDTTSPGILALQGLEALQSLMTWHTSTMERRRLLELAKREELDGLEPQDPRPRGGADGVEDELLNVLASSLSPAASASLTAITETAIALGVSIPSTSDACVHGDEGTRTEAESILNTLATPVFDLTRYVHGLQMEIDEVVRLQGRAEREITDARRRLDELKSRDGVGVSRQWHGDTHGDGYGDGLERGEGRETIQMKVNQWGREGKQISVKIAEYRERIRTLERMTSRADKPGGDSERRIEEVVEMLEAVERRREVVRALEDEVKEFHGLPPDLDASRQEVRRARAELQRLRARREELFERIADKR